MFKNIRNRIMLLNMAMVSAVVIIAFAVVFVAAYAREQSSNREKLMNDPMPQISVAGRPFTTETIHAEPIPIEFRASGFSRRILPDAGLSFSLLVDSEGNLVEINSMLDLPEAAYNQAAAEALKHSGRGASISLENRTWQYAVSAVTVEFLESSNISFVVSGAYRDIRFLDVTDSHKMLWVLGLTLSGLMVAILAAFFFISRFFANRAIQPMEEAFEKQNHFVADASHELKTPLSVINANCGVLYVNKDETIESQVKWVDSIIRATDRMTGLVGDLLSLARMEDKEHEINMSVFDLSAIVSEGIADTEQPALQRGLFIGKSIEPDLKVNNDKAYIQKILTILLDNAIKYVNDGGSVSVSLKKEKHHIVCSVLNSGEGIPHEELSRVFDRFYRGDPARATDTGGYGLGLAIAKSAADRLGIKLTADSEPGQYTEFRLLIGL